MSKLTARLGDGTSGELVHTASMGEEKLYKFVPFKPSPPKEVWINLYPDGRFAATHRSKYSAMTNCENTGAVTLRYILAPESEPQPKPAREWWQVRYKQRPNVLYCTVDTQAEAESIVREDSNGVFKQFEIVHVREVENE